MKKVVLWKMGLTSVFFLGLCACSQTVGPSSSSDDDPIEETSSNYSSAGDSVKGNSSSSTTDKSSSSKCNVKADEICFNEEDPDPIDIERATIFEVPSVSAVIFQWDTTKAVYEFKIVVDGNYSTYAMMEASNIDSLVYEFKWNDEDPGKWTRRTISKKQAGTNSVSYVLHAERTLDGLKELCVSYASARIIWRDQDGLEYFTEWSNPVGPLYTLTKSNDDRTTFAMGLENPCK